MKDDLEYFGNALRAFLRLEPLYQDGRYRREEQFRFTRTDMKRFSRRIRRRKKKVL